MATPTSSARAFGFLLLAAAIVSGIPAPAEPELSSRTNDENATLAVDLVPPLVEEFDEKNVTIFIINLYAVRNHSGDGSEEVLDNSLQEKMPEIIGPLATLFLVVEEGGEDEPVDLDEMAKYMEEHGFKMDKIEESGETSVLRTEVPGQSLDDIEKMLESATDNSLSEKSHKSKKYRAKRMACHKCHHGGGGGGYGGGKGGGGGGGGYGGGATLGVIPVYVVPVAVQQVQQRPQYHPQPVYHQPSGGGCDPCQGRGGGGGGGGGNAWATASASAGAGSW